MSGRGFDLITNPGLGEGRIIFPSLWKNEGHSISSMHPYARRSVSKHKFYDENDLKRDTLTYAKHVRDYMSNIHTFEPSWIDTDSYEERMLKYEKKLMEYNELEKEHRILVQKFLNVPHSSIHEYRIQPPVMLPQPPTEEDDFMPPPPMLRRTHNINWWERVLQDSHEGKTYKRCSRKPRTKRYKKNKKNNKSKCRKHK